MPPKQKTKTTGKKGDEQEKILHVILPATIHHEIKSKALARQMTVKDYIIFLVEKDPTAKQTK